MRRWVIAAVVAIGSGIAVGLWLAQPPARVPEPHVEPAKPTGPQHNVLLVVWDTVRADRMSLYGHDRPTTPHLDARATDAVVFESAYSSSFWTLPAHASLFTGLPTSTHRAHGSNRWLVDSHVTLAERLSAGGYATYGFTQNPNIQPFTNLHRGFDVLETARNAEWAQSVLDYNAAKIPADDASTQVSPAFAGPRQAVFGKDAGPWIQTATEAWLDARSDAGSDAERPWFVFLNYMEAHAPRVPSQASRDAVMTPEQDALAKATPVDIETMKRVQRKEHAFTPEQNDAIRAVYDASIRELDTHFEALMQSLESRGALDDTWVVLLSDHGELLGENGLYGHTRTLADPLVRIPLVVWAPRSLDDRPRGRHRAPVSINDVHGLILEAAGYPGAPTVFDANRPVVSEFLFPAHSKRRPAQRRAWIEADRRLIVSSKGTRFLFDRIGDPTHSVDLSHLEVETTKRMENALDGWVRTHERPDPVEGPPSLEDEDREALEALGYVSP